jgi:hypothetical protein
MDERNDHVTKLMSTLDGQARYAAARVAPLSPVKAVGKDGHVGVGNFRFHPLAIGKDGETRRYLVQLDRTVWRGGGEPGFDAGVECDRRFPVAPRTADAAG